MNLLGRGVSAGDKELKSAYLNPNAAEFVPVSLRPSSGNSSATLGKSVLDRSESSVSNNSDDEAHQYWKSQLPDDITPDFRVTGEDDSHGINNLFTSLSLTDDNDTSRFLDSTSSGFLLKRQQELSPRQNNGMRYPVSPYHEDSSVASFPHLSTNPWEKHIVKNDQLLANVRERPQFDGNSRDSFVANMLNEQPDMGNADINPFPFLSSQFPGLSAECLAKVYFANGGDLNLTIEMLSQLELKIDGNLNQNLSSKALSARNSSGLDFPALSVADNQIGMDKVAGDGFQHNATSYQPSNEDSMLLFKSSSFMPPKGAIDFASNVRKVPPQDFGMWKYERNGIPNANVGSSRSSNGLASSHFSSRAPFRPAPVWLENGEAVANMYSGMREEAREHARLCNAYFEQARKAYLIGNKGLAKELSVRAQLHNMQMKAAHAKAQESFFRQRSPMSPEMQTNGRGHERIIDLQGLHVSEAIHVLKHELALLRNVARSADQRVQAYICVGTGHHTRGSRSPARLPTAVQLYLLEEERLHYSEPQPGLLRVVIY